jgi:hypothetical protein
MTNNNKILNKIENFVDKKHNVTPYTVTHDKMKQNLDEIRIRHVQ